MLRAHHLRGALQQSELLLLLLNLVCPRVGRIDLLAVWNICNESRRGLLLLGLLQKLRIGSRGLLLLLLQLLQQFLVHKVLLVVCLILWLGLLDGAGSLPHEIRLQLLLNMQRELLLLLGENGWLRWRLLLLLFIQPTIQKLR